MLRNVAPSGEVTSYDRCSLALYAALLDANAHGLEWQIAASDLMGLDPQQRGSHECWRSHLDRAAWIIGDGLAEACKTFSSEGSTRRG